MGAPSLEAAGEFQHQLSPQCAVGKVHPSTLNSYQKLSVASSHKDAAINSSDEVVEVLEAL